MATAPNNWVANGHAATGDFDSDAAGTVHEGATLHMGTVEPGSLCALVTVDAETNTLTLAAKWQGSNDGSTWYDVVQPHNPADVVLATGTSGADAAVTKIIEAPAGIYGNRFGRCAVYNGVATGGSADTYSIGYNYVRYPGWRFA